MDGINMKKSSQLFKTTQEAVAYGEKASLEEMVVLLKRTGDCVTALVIDLSVEIQLFNEAYHAFRKDEWYQTYQKISASHK